MRLILIGLILSVSASAAGPEKARSAGFSFAETLERGFPNPSKSPEASLDQGLLGATEGLVAIGGTIAVIHAMHGDEFAEEAEVEATREYDEAHNLHGAGVNREAMAAEKRAKEIEIRALQNRMNAIEMLLQNGHIIHNRDLVTVPSLDYTAVPLTYPERIEYQQELKNITENRLAPARAQLLAIDEKLEPAMRAINARKLEILMQLGKKIETRATAHVALRAMMRVRQQASALMTMIPIAVDAALRINAVSSGKDPGKVPLYNYVVRNLADSPAATEANTVAPIPAN